MRARIAAFALVASFTPLTLAADQALPRLIKQVQPAIATVVGYDTDGNATQIGTGFFVDRRGHLITNRHVLAGAARAEVKGASGRIYPIVRVLAVDAAADLIKVEVDIPITRVRILKMNRETPAPGERVIVIGSPYGLEHSVSDGIVSTVRDAGEFGKMIQITAPISSGSSGSPVMNVAGRVVGVATIQVSDGQNLNFAVPSARAIELKTKVSQTFSDWSADTHEHAALKAAAAGKFDMSLELYQRAVQIRPHSAKAHDGIGMALHALGQYDDARKAYEQAMKYDPRSATIRYHLAELYERQEAWDKAAENYAEAIRIDPAHAQAHRHAALAFVRLGNKDAAMKHYTSLQQLDASLAERLLEEINAAQ